MEKSQLNDNIDTQETVGSSIASEDAALQGNINVDDESSAENSRSSIDGPPTEKKPEVKAALNDSIDTQDTADSSVASEDIVLPENINIDDESSPENSRSSIDGPPTETKPEVKPENENSAEGIEVEMKPDQTLLVSSAENNPITVDDDPKRDQTKPYRLVFEQFVKKNVRMIGAIAAALFVIAILAANLGQKGSTTPDSGMDSAQFAFFNATEEIDTFESMFFGATESPTKTPTLAPSTLAPTKNPSASPSTAPSTLTPSATPSTSMPSFPPSTGAPSVSNEPTISISNPPSLPPTETPTYKPTETPTTSPTQGPTENPTFSPEPTQTLSSSPTYEPTMPVPVVPLDEENKNSVLNFCVIADAPYTKDELKALPKQIATQMEGCEFLVHLGDIFEGDTACDIGGYEAIQKIMLKSSVPAFVVPGDNEWNDCTRANIDIGWNHWANHFIGFENNWKHDLSVVRQPGYEENFYFVQKRTLVVGLNIVGGRLHNATEWRTRHLAEFNWVSDVMIEKLMDANEADGVILMAHAHPKENHGDFFGRMRGFIRDDLKNEFPVLYLHGDGHAFVHTTDYFNQPNFLRIQHEGGTIEPVLKIKAGPGRGPGGRSSVHDAFQYDRQLHLMG